MTRLRSAVEDTEDIPRMPEVRDRAAKTAAVLTIQPLPGFPYAQKSPTARDNATKPLALREPFNAVAPTEK